MKYDDYRGRVTPYGLADDKEDYLQSWRKFNKAVEKFTGMTVTGCDPGIDLWTIENGKYIEGRHVQLPLWFIKMLMEKFEKLERGK
jgi:hypothetical protein